MTTGRAAAGGRALGLLLAVGTTTLGLLGFELALRARPVDLSNPLLLFRGPLQPWHLRAKTPAQVVDTRGAATLRIVCLGGSTTLDRTAFEEAGVTYPSVLEQELQRRAGARVVVEVINAGFEGHTTLHSLVLLESELLPLAPDLLIVHGTINDLMVNYFPGPLVPYYANKLRDGYYVPPQLATPETPLLERIRSYTWLRNRLVGIFPYEVQYAGEELPLPHAGVFRTNLGNIAAIAKRHRMELAFGLEPYVPERGLFERHYSTKSYNSRVRYPDAEQLGRHFEAYHQIIREVAREEGAPLVDAAAALAGERELFVDAVHLRAEGARRVGRAFADELEASGLLERLIERAELRAER